MIITCFRTDEDRMKAEQVSLKAYVCKFGKGITERSTNSLRKKHQCFATQKLILQICYQLQSKKMFIFEYYSLKITTALLDFFQSITKFLLK